MIRIFCLGFPKCATSSFHHAFKKAGLISIHEFRYDDIFGKRRKVSVFEYLNRANKDELPLLHYCSDINTFTQMDWSGNDAPTPGFPQILFFQKLDQQYPESKFVLNTRPIQNWLRSLRYYSGGDLVKNWIKAELPGLPKGKGTTDEELTTWYQWHCDNVRNYFSGKNNFLEINIEDDFGKNQNTLREFLQLKKFTWLHHNAS